MINLHKKLLGEVPMVYNGGGGKGAPPQVVNKTIPTAPIDEAAVEIGRETTRDDDKKRTKKSLSLPMFDSGYTGIKNRKGLTND